VIVHKQSRAQRARSLFPFDTVAIFDDSALD
jgi:hypothetical protein